MSKISTQILPVLGFVAVVAAIGFLLNPTLLRGDAEPAPALAEVHDSSTLRSSEVSDAPQDSVQYAEGYDEATFQGMEPPKDPRIDENGQRIDPVGPWKTMLSLKFQLKYNDETGDVDYLPMFTPAIRKLDGQWVELQGFIVPHELSRTQGKGEMFMFSAFPAASCFFCGAAGPESIVEVYPKKPIPYTKQQTKIKGKLRLNEKDPLKMAYIVEQAESLD